jgi:hypothetical protein
MRIARAVLVVLIFISAAIVSWGCSGAYSSAAGTAGGRLSAPGASLWMLRVFSLRVLSLRMLAGGMLAGGMIRIGIGLLTALAAHPEKGEAADRCHDHQNSHCLSHVT